MEEENLEYKGDDDTGSIVRQSHDMSLLTLETKDEEHLGDVADNSQDDHSPPVHGVAVGEAEETHGGTNYGQLRHGEDPGGDGQGGPVHVPEVPDDDSDDATDSVGDEESDGGVHHVIIVLLAGVSKHNGRLNNKEDPTGHENQVQDFEYSTSFLQKDAS